MIQLHAFLVELLQCPGCGGPLNWTVLRSSGRRIQEADARCRDCGHVYPVRGEIARFLPPASELYDPWAAMAQRLTGYLSFHPQARAMLLGADTAALGPADLFFRAAALELRGDFQGAGEAAEMARAGLYHQEFLQCYQEQLDALIGRLSCGAAPVIDLASGQCLLVEHLARRLPGPVVATDISPWISERNRRWLEFRGLLHKVSLMAVDPRRTPFRDSSVPIVTTNLGLANLEAPDEVLAELRRFVSGRFLAVTHFYPEDDAANAAAIFRVGLGGTLFQEALVGRLATAGWQVDIVSQSRGTAGPTPVGRVIAGAGVDGLPVAKTMLTWCCLEARRAP